MIRVVGTAGHVDHGKSALVEALTGTHPDRLREERERQMTIDLGFAWTTLPGGIEVGLIDVPGHRDFIDNMLAGVGGFDAALLVVAADEGVMPQTREHLAILDLLEIPRGLVALTKMDLVEDAEWADLVEDEIRRAVDGTALAGAPVYRVSARRGDGIPALREGLAERLGGSPARRDLRRPRLPIDRAFVMTGFGTVVTGTLIDGELEVGQEVVVLGDGRRGRIRGLQTHRRSVERAAPGSRVAVNLAGVETQAVRRGDVLCLPGDLTPTRRLDVHVRVLADAPVGIQHGQELKLHVGAADVVARARTLGVEQIDPAEEGWVQLLLQETVAVADGDRFILRRPAPPATLGGGSVVDAHPRRLHRRRHPSVIEGLRARSHGTPADRLRRELAERGPLTREEVDAWLAAALADPGEALEDLLQSGRVRRLGPAEAEGPGVYVEVEAWRSLAGRVRAILERYHAAHRLRPGIPREELRSKLGIDGRAMDRIVGGLAAEGEIVAEGARVRRGGFEPRLTEAEGRSLAELEERFRRAPFAPPSVREARAALGDELWALVVGRGDFVEVAPDVAFDAPTYRTLVEAVGEALAKGEPITVAEVRDRYATTRKYALALLEHLDQIGMTVRVGDERKLKPGWRPPQPGPPSG